MGYKTAVIKLLRQILLNQFHMMKYMQKCRGDVERMIDLSEELYKKTDVVNL